VQLRDDEVVPYEEVFLHRGGRNAEEVKQERPHDEDDHDGHDEGLAPLSKLALARVGVPARIVGRHTGVEVE
jgi:hypothetical protein